MVSAICCFRKTPGFFLAWLTTIEKRDMLALMQMAAIDSDDEWLDMMFEHYADQKEARAQDALRRRLMNFDLSPLSSVQ